MREKTLKLDFLIYLYNRLDFLIRFIYTQVPFVRDVLRLMLKATLYESDLEGLSTKYQDIKATLVTLDLDFTPFSEKIVMELGPGTSLIIALNCLFDGANKVYLVDKYPRLDHESISRNIGYFKKNSSTCLKKFINLQTFELNPDHLALVENSVEDLKDVESKEIDVILSHNVLEHVRNVRSSFKEMFRVLKPGGLMHHHIDFRDHYNFDKPLKFLKYSDWVYESFLTKEKYSFTNRLRLDDYLQLIHSTGFEVAELEKKTLPPDNLNRHRLHKKFKDKDKEVLLTSECDITARKPVAD